MARQTAPYWWPIYFPGTEGSDPFEFFEFNSELYFRAISDAGNELWKTDGTEAGTVLVADINPGGDSVPADFFEFNGELFFLADDGESGREVWKTDGTPDGTLQLFDVLDGPQSSQARKFFEFNGEMLFIAVDQVAADIAIHRLWRSNGETAGTTRAADEIVLSLDTIEFEDKVFFSGFGPGTFVEPRSYNGENVTIIRDIADGEASSNPQTFFEFKSEVYFSAETVGEGRELWKTDGTSDGTTLVLDIHAGEGSSSPDHFFEFEGELYFSADDGVHGREIWKTDGTTAGTQLVVDAVEGEGSGIINPHFQLLGDVGLAFFVEVPGTVGEVWQIPIVPEPTGFPGDANLDEVVDFADFLTLANNFGKSDAVFRDGDFDSNGVVNFSDFLTLASTFGRSYAVQSVSITTFGFVLDNSRAEYAFRLTGDRSVRADAAPGLTNPPRIVGSIDFDGNIFGQFDGRVDENGTYFRGDIVVGSLTADGRVLVDAVERGTIANGEIVINNFGSGTYHGNPRDVAAIVFFEFFFDLF